ncbi:MAG: substrate-binding domain-containing protein [Fimbriimonadaceae bacterium]|nr:substrate-binding domain-containing protein [Fimbriimonadaceae bacterium]
MPAHQQVRRSLLDAIHRTKMEPGTKIPGEPELAAMFQVSRMTVNKAILTLVADGVLTREKGRGTYTSGQSPASHSVRQVYVALKEEPTLAMEDYYLGALYWRIHAHLACRGIFVTLADLNRDLEAQLSPQSAVVAVNPHHRSLADLSALAESGVPTVMVGAGWSEPGVRTVDSDNLLGAALAVNELSDAGHRNVLMIAACPEDSNTMDRERGFRMAMKTRELPMDAGNILHAPSALGFDLEFESVLFDRIAERRVTAIFAAGAHLALRLLAAAQRRRIRVPEDLSIIGYDDPTFLSMAHPSITTLRQPIDAMAQAACELVLQPEPLTHPADRRILDPILVRRQSVAPNHGFFHCNG